MNTVEKVSIGGYVFLMESGADTSAAAYLEELKRFYAGTQSGNEILEGIEERMAELLLEQAGAGQVVTAPMVEQVMATLGRPEAIEAEEGDAPDRVASEAQEETPKRRLYRDDSSRVVAGVCSGLGVFCNIDPVVFRLAFILLTLLGVGVGSRTGWQGFFPVSIPVLYIILWICMPMARTVRQRDELRGQRGTVDGISERIRRDSLVDTSYDGVPRHTVLSRLLRIVGFCAGIVIFLCGIALLAGLSAAVLGNASLSNGFWYNKFLEEFSVFGVGLSFLASNPVVPVLAVLSVLLPAVGLVYAGVLLIFGLRSPRWHPGVWIFLLWLVVLVALAVLAVIALVNGSVA